VTSYSVGNVIPGVDPLSSPGTMETVSLSPQPSPLSSPSLSLSPLPSGPSLPQSSPSSSSRGRDHKRARSGGSRQQISTAAAGPDHISFAAFKSLPVDYTKERAGSEAVGYGALPSGFVRRGKTCQENIGEMCEVLLSACAQAGLDPGNLIVERDIVSVAEAERTTPVFAKAEYAIKRLLWLGS